MPNNFSIKGPLGQTSVEPGRENRYKV
jgi:hypothetical protein